MPKSEKQRPAVMADVAELAGVSHQTVSRVLHDSPHVRGDTRERVLAAIRQLDYRPNSMARALVTGRSKTLGVVSSVAERREEVPYRVLHILLFAHGAIVEHVLHFVLELVRWSESSTSSSSVPAVRV